jgi:putative redox protein
VGNITLRWVAGALMVGSDSNGHSVVIGRNPDDKSEILGMKASDLLLVAAAACSAYDVVEILTKQREPLQDLVVHCQGDQQSDPPYKFTRINLHYVFKGSLNPKKVEKAIQLSEDKYCAVTNTLRPGVPITSDYEILD